MAGTAGVSWLIADYLHLPLDVWAGATRFGKGRLPPAARRQKIFPLSDTDPAWPRWSALRPVPSCRPS